MPTKKIKRTRQSVPMNDRLITLKTRNGTFSFLRSMYVSHGKCDNTYTLQLMGSQVSQFVCDDPIDVVKFHIERQ